MTQPCHQCTAGPTGETGHADLDFYVVGPYPGHRIYNCHACGERWIRHYGAVERFAWTRYATQFQMRKPRADAPAARVTPL